MPQNGNTESLGTEATRWAQGHGVISPQVGHYARTAEGLTRLARDFYSYAVAPDGRPSAPMAAMSRLTRLAV
jgi:hypothetical protein